MSIAWEYRASVETVCVVTRVLRSASGDPSPRYHPKQVASRSGSPAVEAEEM